MEGEKREGGRTGGRGEGGGGGAVRLVLRLLLLGRNEQLAQFAFIFLFRLPFNRLVLFVVQQALAQLGAVATCIPDVAPQKILFIGVDLDFFLRLVVCERHGEGVEQHHTVLRADTLDSGVRHCVQEVHHAALGDGHGVKEERLDQRAVIDALLRAWIEVGVKEAEFEAWKEGGVGVRRTHKQTCDQQLLVRFQIGAPNPAVPVNRLSSHPLRRNENLARSELALLWICNRCGTELVHVATNEAMKIFNDGALIECTEIGDRSLNHTAGDDRLSWNRLVHGPQLLLVHERLYSLSDRGRCD